MTFYMVSSKPHLEAYKASYRSNGTISAYKIVHPPQYRHDNARRTSAYTATCPLNHQNNASECPE